MEYRGDINKLLNRYVDFVDKISSDNHYENNIRHLLYLIVPAFVFKYGVDKENTILKCFENVKIIISGTEDRQVLASFNRKLVRDSDGYHTIKYIILNKYKTTPTISELLDSIIHEYSHAINSINNEISYDDKYIKVRTGLSYLIYDKNSLTFIKKSDEVHLEEIINTTQTEEIVNIINSFNDIDVDNVEFKTTLYTLDNEINKVYKSNAYEFDKYICEQLMNNKTFIPTICNLRFKGFVEDIESLFDNVMGRTGAYRELNTLLAEIHTLEIKYVTRHLFKNKILNKLRNKSNRVMDIVKEYDDKCVYK